jgi:hypothetical protein
MSAKQNKNRDPLKRAAKRARQREAAARGQQAPGKARPSQSQMTHASSGRARKKAREGEAAMEKEYGHGT